MSLITYFKDTRAEMHHVSWPTQKQAVIFTLLVVAFSAIMGVILGFADFIFARALDWFISTQA